MNLRLLTVAFLVFISACGKDKNDDNAFFRNIPLKADGSSLSGWKQVYLTNGVATDSQFIVISIDSSRKTASFYDMFFDRMRQTFQFDNSWSPIRYTKFEISGGNLVNTVSRDGTGRLINISSRYDNGGNSSEVDVNTIVYSDSVKFVRQLTSQKDPDYSWTELYDKSNRLISMSKVYNDSSKVIPWLNTWDYKTNYDTEKHLTDFSWEERSNVINPSVYELFATGMTSYTWQSKADFLALGRIEKMIYGSDLNFLRGSELLLPDICFAMGWQNMSKIPLQVVFTRTFWANGVAGTSNRTEWNYSFQLTGSGKISRLNAVSDKNVETRTTFYYY